MNKTLLLVAVALAGVVSSPAQDTARTVSTSTMDGARFEIIQSPLDNSVMFRLDKFSGSIDRLATCPKDDGYGSKLCWKEMVVLELPKLVPAARPRYQVVINAAWKVTMLIQIETGRTWQLGVDPQDRWSPFIDCSDKSNSSCLWRP